MEITSFGLASKAANDLKSIRRDMGSGVTGAYSNVKERLDKVEEDIEMAYKLTNEVIINNAINISKAEYKINAYAKSMKFQMEQMIFDDLYDLSGIDLSLSSGYSHNYTNGVVQGGTLITREIYLNNCKNILVDCNGDFSIYYSFGDSWKQLINNELVYLTEKEQKQTSMKLKFQLGSNQTLQYYSVLWS